MYRRENKWHESQVYSLLNFHIRRYQYNHHPEQDTDISSPLEVPMWSFPVSSPHLELTIVLTSIVIINQHHLLSPEFFLLHHSWDQGLWKELTLVSADSRAPDLKFT